MSPVRTPRGEIPERVTASHPCPLCERERWCCYWADGTVLCTSYPSDKPVSTGWVHKPNGEVRMTKDAEKAAAVDRQRIVKFVAAACAKVTSADKRRIARLLGVPEFAVAESPGVFTGRDAGGPFDGFVMSSPDPSTGLWTACGYSRRYADGSKKAVGRLGLFLPPAVAAGGGVLFVVEGASDVLAMYGAGLEAVGRPSNIAGSELVTEYVFGYPAGTWRAVVVVAENDEKEDGLSPGLSGSCAVADRVRAAMRAAKRPMPVFVRSMLGAAKDPRAWFKLSGYSEASAGSLHSHLTAGIRRAES